MIDYRQTRVMITCEGKKIEARQIILPMCPSENERLEVNWAGVKNTMFGGVFKNGKKKQGVLKNSTFYNRWKRASSTLMRIGKLPQLKGELAVFLTVVFPDNHTRDAPNRIKAVLDAMQESEHVFENDKQVTMLTCCRKIIKDEQFLLAYVVEREKLGHTWFEVNDEYIGSLINAKPKSNN